MVLVVQTAPVIPLFPFPDATWLAAMNWAAYEPARDGSARLTASISANPMSAEVVVTVRAKFFPSDEVHPTPAEGELPICVFGVAVSNGVGYFTTANGVVNELGGLGWGAPTSGTGCAPTPAVANNIVYAGGCSNIQAFDAGELLWGVSSGTPLAMTVANGVLYSCTHYGSIGTAVLEAYDATFGTRLWTGGFCSTQPVPVNGNLYSTYAELDAYKFGTSTVTIRKPDPASLVPNRKLRRRRRRHQPQIVPLGQ